MDHMIEMKDFQGGTADDDNYDDEELVGMDMRSGTKNPFLPIPQETQTTVENGDLDECHTEQPIEPGVFSWLQRRPMEKKQNRWLIILMSTFLMAAIVYVIGAVYMSDDSVDALVQPFDRESGFVENGAENEKEQAIMDNAHHNENQATASHWGGQRNPFASTVNQQQHQYHQGFISQGDGGHGGAGNLGHDGLIGNKRNGKFGHHQGTNIVGEQQENTTTTGTDGSSSNNGNNDVSVNNDDTSSNAVSPPQPNPSDIDENDVYCEDLSRYRSWYDAAVTKESGPQFRVVKQYDHDKRAFTYVDVNRPKMLFLNFRRTSTFLFAFYSHKVFVQSLLVKD
jgi:hypothetical protein